MKDIEEQQAIAEINKLHQDLQELATGALDRAIRLGELLSAAKSRLPHGQWLPWLASNVAFSERTARNYMRIFENRAALKSANVADFGEAYRLLGYLSPLSSGSRATQEQLAQSSEGPPMTREEAEQLHARLIALIQERLPQISKLFAQLLEYCCSESSEPVFVDRFLERADELEFTFGPSVVPKDARRRLLERKRRSRAATNPAATGPIKTIAN
jgi:hypothetical protein